MQSQDYRKQAAQSSARQQHQELSATFRNSVAQYQQDIQHYNYYQQQALPNALEIVETAQLGYRTGDISYVEYLYALQTTTDIQLGYLKSIQEINQSVIGIE